MKLKEIIYFTLPLVLWPLSFIVFKSYFIYAVTISTFIFALTSIVWFKDYITWFKGKASIIFLAGVIGSVILYLMFFVGNVAASITGMGVSVNNVYFMIGKNNFLVPFLLPVIGIFEEMYWRGGMQGFVKKRFKFFSNMPWLFTTAYYSLIHIATLNPILPLAALFVGIVTSLLADRYGIFASMLTHIIWIEAIVVFFPL
jgi:hypothetical protein